MVHTLCYALASSLAIGVLVGSGGVATAQPPAAPSLQPPGGPPPQYATPPPPPATAQVPVVPAAEPSFLRWGLGAHLGGMGVSPKRNGDIDETNKTDLGLIGVQLRFRLHRRWELELDFSHMEGERPGPGDTHRSSGAIILGGMFHINPDSRWLWSVLLGIGGVRDRIWYEKGGDRVTQAEFSEGVARIGIGLERRFARWGLAAQLYGIGLDRNDEELDGPAYAGRDGPVPEHSSGGLFQLAANYYF